MGTLTYGITGVATGIGAALAARLKKAGHRVVGFDIVDTADNVDQFIALNLADTASIDRAVGEVSEPLDGLCNNAGVPPRPGNEALILQVNFLGQRQLMQGVLPRMRDGGSIVNMASRAGHGWRDNIEQIKRFAALSDADAVDAFVQDEGIDSTRAYNLSKEAMILWTLAETEPAIQRGIRCNAISPGAIATDILDDFARAFGDKMARNVERAGRPGTPDEVAALAQWLLSPDSAWIKGVDIPVDGGMGAFAVTDALDLDQLRQR